MGSFGLRTKLTLMFVGVLVIAIGAASLMIRDLFYQQVIAQKKTTADILTASVVHDIKYDQEAGRTSFETIIRKYVTYYRGISALSYYNTDFVVTADAQDSNVGRVTDDPRILAALKKAKPLLEILTLNDEELVIRSIAPVLRGSKITGAVVMDLSIEDIEKKIYEINRRVGTILLVAAVGAAVVLFVLLRSSILTRVSRLTAMTREVAEGNYAIGIGDQKRDELGELARAFDQMTEDLRRSKEELDIYHSKRLEQKVRDATAQLEKAYKDLQNAQSQIVLTEKMASLGVLIAGIAHEINTPVGAIANVAGSLQTQIRLLPNLISSLPASDNECGGEMTAFLDEVIIKAGKLSSLPSLQSTRKIEAQLRHKGVQNVREVSSFLATFDLLDEHTLDQYSRCLGQPAVMELGRCVGNITQGATVAASSCNKIEEIIKALKYYAYTDKSKVEQTDIKQSVNTALVLLRNKLKYSINVEADWGENIPPVACTSEIHQVWTNLLSNACDAVTEVGEQHDGKIHVSTRSAGDAVVVEISDNGVGIPETARNSIFDPFFTTKGIGKGTGLGLSIVSGIVKKHHGSIEVESCSGKTAFRVFLPINGVKGLDPSRVSNELEEGDESEPEAAGQKA